jgi:hypothetical protein
LIIPIFGEDAYPYKYLSIRPAKKDCLPAITPFLNAIAKAKKPYEMALAFKNGVIAGRQSFLAGRIDKYLYGYASSPKIGIIK